MESSDGTGGRKVKLTLSILTLQMRAFLLFFIFLLVSDGINAQYSTVVKKLYSIHVKDSFEIYITAPADASDTTRYDKVIYYLDANLKSGKQLREIAEEDKVRYLKNFLYIGIGHTGNYHR